jgi:hypothetical protein
MLLEEMWPGAMYWDTNMTTAINIESTGILYIKVSHSLHVWLLVLCRRWGTWVWTQGISTTWAMLSALFVLSISNKVLHLYLSWHSSCLAGKTDCITLPSFYWMRCLSLIISKFMYMKYIQYTDVLHSHTTMLQNFRTYSSCAPVFWYLLSTLAPSSLPIYFLRESLVYCVLHPLLTS